MNELINIASADFGGQPVQTVNARELHAFLEVGKDFSSWIKARIEQYSFVEGQDFVMFESAPQNGGAGNRGIRVEYSLTLGMAKELAMVERNAKGKEARQYFIECERQAKVVALSPANLSRMQLIELALQSEQERLLLEAQVAEQAPKVEALDRLATADGSFCVRDAAKNLQMQEKKLKQLLSEKRWMYRRPMGTGWLAYSDKLQQGLLEHKVTRGEKSDGSEWVDTQARITAKGMTVLSQMISSGEVAGLFPELAYGNRNAKRAH